jgi:hypothetical protein
MNASDPSPCKGHEGSESYDYQTVCESLLQYELEASALEVREAFLDVSQSVERGDELSYDDWWELQHSLEQAQMLVDVIEKGLGDSESVEEAQE